MRREEGEIREIRDTANTARGYLRSVIGGPCFKERENDLAWSDLVWALSLVWAAATLVVGDEAVIISI